MILPIVQLGDPVLRVRARDVTPEELASGSLTATVAAMRETMIAAPGVGLAGPQIGLGIRLAVLEDAATADPDDPDAAELERRALPFTVFINPTYQPAGKETREFFEGCLSMDGYRALVRRHARVVARWTDLAGADHEQIFEGWQARIVQHEIDHLNGVVYVDRCEPRSLTTVANLAVHWSDATPADVRRELAITE